MTDLQRVKLAEALLAVKTAQACIDVAQVTGPADDAVWAARQALDQPASLLSSVLYANRS